MDTYETINRLQAQGTGVVLQLSAHDLRCVVGEIMRSEREKMSREAKEAASMPSVTRKEAAAFLRCSLKTLHTLDTTGDLRPVRIGTKVLYRQKDLETFLSSQTQDGPGSRLKLRR